MIISMSTIQLPFLKQPARRFTFPNGFTVLFVPKQGDVFTLSTWVKTGSIHEDDQINGISHFLEHLMFKGTERFRPGEFDHAMESLGMVINAATWKDFTFYYISGPKGADNQPFLTALDMHADMMLHSTLPEAEIGPAYDPEDADYQGEKRERSVVIEEIAMREDQPWTKAYNAVNRMMYPEGHPYRRDVIGTRQIIGNIPRQTLLSYYHQWYSPSQLTTIVVGNFDEDWVLAEIEKAFAFPAHLLAQTPNPLTTFDFTPTPGGLEILHGNYETSFFISAFHGPKPTALKETIALDVFSYVLGEGRSSRLTQNLLEKPAQPIFNAASTGQSTFKLGNVFFIQGNFTGASVDQCMADVRRELEQLLISDPMTEEVFQRAVKKLKVDFAETSETTSGIAETIGESVTIAGDLSLYTDYLEALSALTLADVQQTAERYLQPEKAYTAVLTHG
jgi:zinc protease